MHVCGFRVQKYNQSRRKQGELADEAGKKLLLLSKGFAVKKAEEPKSPYSEE